MLETRTVKTSKLQDRGVTTMFVGYNLNMGSDVYRMWNEEIKRIHNTKDITWLNVYNNNRNRKTNVLHPTPSAWENKSKVTDEDGSCLEIIDDIMKDDASDSNDDDDGDDDGDGDGDDYDNENADEEGDDDEDDNIIIDDRSTRRGTKTRSVKVTYCPARLIDEGVACVGAGIGGGYTSTTEIKPMKFKEAMRSRDREEWKKAVGEEHNNMKIYPMDTSTDQGRPYKCKNTYVNMGNEEKGKQYLQS